MRRLGEGIGKLCKKCITKFFNKANFDPKFYCVRCRKELQADAQLAKQVFASAESLDEYVITRGLQGE